MIVLGITGGIGSGKSTVSEILALSNIPVYIADKESKRLTSSSRSIRKKLTDLFGKELYRNDVLNKQLLASIIFNDKEKLKAVNRIIHPEVKEDLQKWIKEKSSAYSLVATESAIMFESGFYKLADKMLTVYAPPDIRISRVMKRDNTTREKVQERIKTQMSDEEKVKLSDYVVYTDDKHSLIEQTLQIVQDLQK